MTDSVRIGIVTVSDRAHRGVYEDRGGPAVEAWLRAALAEDFESLRRIVPDERELIEAALLELCDDAGCCLVVTTGGTGPAPRDVTPEAVDAVCEKHLPGFGEQMRRVSVDAVPTAILSRQAAGIRGASLLLSLPGNPNAIDDCLAAVFPAVPHAIRLIGGPTLATIAPAPQTPD
ncbi:MAG: molybdopterin adenylyltransferase [Acidobacteriota bacterium]